jgi:polyisoprenoid-binding protein YceI
MRLLLLGLMTVSSALSQQVHIELDPNATKIGFTLGDVLHTVHGAFKLTKGEMEFDPATGKAGGWLIVSANTGDSGSHARDSRMAKNVLQTDQYPDITFVPDRIEGKINNPGDSDIQLHGLFGIHGATHDLTMHVKSHLSENRMTATATFEVPYVKWGLKDPSTFVLRVSNLVQIEITAVGLVKQ